MPDDDRPDIGAMAYRLTRRVAEAEEPVLAEHGVTMWEYVVLTALRTGPASTQGELARLTGRDPTRLIALLDTLGHRGLVRREPDARDRRRRVVTLTEAGEQLLTRCRTAVRALEQQLLGDVAPEDRPPFLRALARLTSTPR